MKQTRKDLTQRGENMTAKQCCDYVLQHTEIRYATNSGPYKSGRKIKPVGCVNHSLGIAQPSVDKVFESMNNPSAGWGVHAILGDFDKGEGKILLTLPWEIRSWGIGGGVYGSWNDSRVQWEICEPKGHTYNGGTMVGYDIQKNQAYFDRMWKLLVAWNVFCAIKFDYGVNMINDHSEGHAKGYGSNHADVGHWFPKHGKSMDILRLEVSKILEGSTEDAPLKTVDLKDLTETDVVMKVGPLFTKEQERCGILASVSMAQFILESGYGKTELAQKANNCFGMKATLSGNDWKGSTWDGKSTCVISTKEYSEETGWITIKDTFRKYSCIEDSIKDHSAYLLNAKNGDKKRYAGLKQCKKPKKAITIIKNGGYATDPNYISKIMSIIKRYNLTQYDLGNSNPNNDTVPDETAKNYKVKVASGNLRIRTGPGTDYTWNGLYTGPGVFTIVKTQAGVGSDAGWGLLLSYKAKENGWIALDYATKVK